MGCDNMDENSINIPTSFFGLNRHDVRQYIQDLLAEEEKHISKPAEVKRQLEESKKRLLTDLNEVKKVDTIHNKEIVATKSKDSDEVIIEARKRLKKTTSQITVLVDEEARKITEKANEQLAEYENTLIVLQEIIVENKEKIDSLLSDVLKLLKSNLVEEKTNESIIEKEKTKEIDVTDDRRTAVRNELKHVAVEETSIDFLHNLFAFKKRPLPRVDDEHRYNEFSYNEEYFDYDNESDNPDMTSLEDEYQEADLKSNSESEKNRNSFIIGKIAGDDLFDSNNCILVEKGKILTEGDIILAEKELKLPELIVNMVMPK